MMYLTSTNVLGLTLGAFTYDVRCFWGIFDLPTYPNQMIYYISLERPNREFEKNVMG